MKSFRIWLANLFSRDYWFPIELKKLYTTFGLYRYELWIGYHCIPLTGFWFGKPY